MGAEFAALDAALQDAPDQVGAGTDHFLLVERRELGEVARLADHQLGDAGGAVAPTRSHQTCMQ